MKVLIVRTFPNILNSMQYNMQEIGLAKALTKQGCQCGIVLYNGKNKDCIETIPVSWEGHTESITIYRLHGYNLLKNGIFPSLNNIAKQYDVIQVHEYDQLTSWWYYAWKKQPVVIYHGPYYHPFNKGYNLKCKIFDNVFLRIRHNRNVPCLTKSNMAAKFLTNKGFTNVTSVGVGLDTDDFNNTLENTEEVNAKIKIDTNKFTVIYIGKIEERRNSIFLMRLINSILDRHGDIEFIIVGSGERKYQKDCLEIIGKHIKSARVKHYFSASQKELVRLYQNSGLMIFPSNYDIFGMVLLEAAYFSVPIISTKNGGAETLIREGFNGTIIDNLDRENWIEAIEKIYQNRTNLKKTNDEQLSSTFKYSWDNLVSYFIDNYAKANKQ